MSALDEQMNNTNVALRHRRRKHL